MNILHINCNYVGTALHRVMIKHMIGNDSVTVFTPLCDKHKIEEFKPQKNEVLSACFNKSDKLLYFHKQKKIFKALMHEVKNIDKFEIIHAFTLLTDGNVAYRLSKKTGIPYVVAIRDTDVNDFFRLKPYLIPLGVEIMRNASAVFFLSEAYRKLVIEKFTPIKFRKQIYDKSFVVPNGIDDFWLDNTYLDKNLSVNADRINNKKLSVICVGRINKRKNIPLIQKSMSILRERGWNVNLTVIGKAENESELRKVKEDKYTVYHEPLTKEKLIDYYREADIFVLASHTETFGLVYAEAMSQGLPVIYTRGQGFDGQFPDGEVGYAVSDKNAAEIADKIEAVCRDYTRIEKNALKNVQKFKWNDICEQYRNIYMKLSKCRQGRE